jgi:MIP family channel proteins
MDFARLWRPLLAEVIGTFMLVFVGGGTAALAPSLQAAGVVATALAHGLTLMIIVYTYGHISGAHVNPAVTFGVTVARRMDPLVAVLYMLAQFGGAILAGLLLLFLLGPAQGNLGATRWWQGSSLSGLGIDDLKAVVIEATLTFFLVSSVLQAAVYGRAGNFAGLVIGLTLAAAILFGGPLTGASLNPARSFGSEFALWYGAGPSDWPHFWIYLVGPLLGGALAGLVQSFLFAPGETPPPPEPGRLPRREVEDDDEDDDEDEY